MTPEFKESLAFPSGLTEEDSHLLEFSLEILKNEDKLKKLLKEEIEKEIKSGIADKISQEVTLRNAIGPDFINLSKEEKNKFIALVDEIHLQIKSEKEAKKRKDFYSRLSDGAGKGILRDGKRMGMPSEKDEKETIKKWEDGMNYGFDDIEK